MICIWWKSWNVAKTINIVKSARICIWSKSWNNLNSLKEKTDLSLECDIISQFYISWYLLDGHQEPRRWPWLYTRKTGENKKSLNSRSFLYFLDVNSISPCRVSSPTRPEIIPGSWLIRSRLCQRVEWCFPQYCNVYVMLHKFCCIKYTFSEHNYEQQYIRVWYLRIPGLETFVKFWVPWTWYYDIWP